MRMFGIISITETRMNIEAVWIMKNIRATGTMMQTGKGTVNR